MAASFARRWAVCRAFAVAAPSGTTRPGPRKNAARRIPLLVSLVAVLPAPAAPPPFPAGDLKFFEEKVRPLLVERCQKCHGKEKHRGGLRLDSRAAVLAGGESGPAAVAGKPEESLLVRAVRHGEALKMPPQTKLPPAEVATLAAWVKMGLPWPDAAAVALVPPPQPGGPSFTPEQKSFWAFQSPKAEAPPAVRNQAWVRSPIDAFILARLEASGLRPAPPADRRTLIRRATFDLTGLPPTPAEVDAFLADASPDAFARVVNRLLASPAYGERWGRHWLDVARYADSNGMDENLAYGNAWRYRDYVVAAFNRDKPYDRFVREQLAGDLLPFAGDPAADAERVVATGFLCIGPKMLAEDDPVKMQMDIIDEQIDTVGQAFLGLTLGCARCHDHKFDPIRQADYYGLAGIFKSTQTMDTFTVVARWHERPLAVPGAVACREAHDKVLSAKKAAFDRRNREAAGAARREARQNAARYIRAAAAFREARAHAGDGPFPHIDKLALVPWKLPGGKPAPVPQTLEQTAAAQGLNPGFLRHWVEYLDRHGRVPEGDTLRDVLKDSNGPVRVTPAVEAGYPRAVAEELKRLKHEVDELEKNRPTLPETMAVEESKAVTNVRIHLRGNHLTQGAEVPRRFPRVLAGEDQPAIDPRHSGRLELARWLTRPDHPLTARVLVNRVWLGHFGEGLVRSPDNFGRLGERPTHPELLDWLARQFVAGGWSVKALHRRVMLSSTYQMSTAYDERAAQMDPDNRLCWRFNRQRLDAEAMRDSLLALGGRLDRAMGGSLFKGKHRAYVPGYPNANYDGYESDRRTVYLPVIRSDVFNVLQTFDFADPSVLTGKRPITTVAPQALFLMNGKLVHEQTRHLAHRLLDTTADPAGRVRALFERAYARLPGPRDQARALEFVERYRRELAGAGLAPPEQELRSWQALCRVVLSANEFLYVE